jgi:hypothetical protein
VDIPLITDQVNVRNEILRFPTTGDTASLHIKLFDHKTLGKDKELGEAVVDVSLLGSS